MTRRVSLAELADADIQLRPAEAVALVVEVCRRRQAAELRGIPPPGIIRLTADGEIVIEGPVTRGDDVTLAAQLLDGLLAPFDAVPEYRASGALRLVIGRASGTLDLPPYHSLDEFCVGLQRFTSQDVAETARMLFLAWDRARATRELRAAEPAALTISDIRRARRATGLSLEDIASVAEVPPTQLRDLEWGYMRNWRADPNGRAQLVRYARAAGLDEGLVVSIAWPMIEQAAAFAPPAPAESTALVRSGPQQIATVSTPLVRRKLARAAWTAAAVAALLVALVPAVAVPWSSLPARRVAIDAPVPVRIEFTPRAGEPAPPPVVIKPAVRHAPARAAAAPAKRRTAPPQKRPPAQEKSLLNRELFRVVFR